MILRRIGKQQEQDARIRVQLAKVEFRGALRRAAFQTEMIGQPRAWLHFHPLLTCGAVFAVGGVAAAIVRRLIPRTQIPVTTVTVRARPQNRLHRIVAGGFLLALRMVRQSLGAAAMQIVAGALSPPQQPAPEQRADTRPRQE